MDFFRNKNELQYFDDKVDKLETLKTELSSFQLVGKLDEELIKKVPTFYGNTADNKHPILATDSLYNCTGILAYDLNKQYGHLCHSFPNQICKKNNLGLPAVSKHVTEILNALSKRELYQLKFIILVGNRADKSMINLMINSIIYLKNRNISVESIELIKTFIREIHLYEDQNLGGSFAFDTQSGNKYTYNPHTGEYYQYQDTNASILIR